MVEDEVSIPEESTKSDPLSSATRAAKRNLLAASLIAVTFKAFNISVERISVVGVNMDFDRGVFEFLILASLAYFLATFCLYYYIDIRNFPRTAHENRTDAWKKLHLRKFTQQYWEATAEMAKACPKSKYIEAYITDRYAEYLTSLVSKPIWPTTLGVLKGMGALQRWSHFLRQPVKVDLTTQRTIHHEDAETIFG
jgi:hypothetical protein